jgi:hypothetical protein
MIMKTIDYQRILFVICAIVAILSLISERLQFLKYILLAGSAVYLFLGWNMELIIKGKSYLAHGLTGYIYSTVFFATFFKLTFKEFSSYLIWFGFFMAIILVLYMIMRHKTVKTDMFIQSVFLLILAPLPALL